DHIDYWLSLGRPVLLICVSVDRQLAWWKRLDTWFADPRRRSKGVVEFDAIADAFVPSSAHRVAAIATPLRRPLVLAPGRELLTSNLLEVAAFAQSIASAPSSCRDRE